MKYELVEFYPITEKNRGKLKEDVLGSVHIFCIDCKLDIRGIKIRKWQKGLVFQMPHIHGMDQETGEKVTYPVVRWMEKADQDEMMHFLHKIVKPIVKERLGLKNEKQKPKIKNKVQDKQ